MRALLTLAGPIVLTQVGQMMLGIVDTMLAGRLSVTALDAVTLGHLFQMATVLPAYGIVIGLDPLVSQAQGAGRGDDAGVALQRGVLLALVCSVPVAGSWFYTEHVLLALGQAPELCREAARFTQVQVFSVPAFLLFGAQSAYLTARGIVRPGVFVMLLANVFNACAGWALIFGHFGFPALGVWGAGLATGLTRTLLALLVFALIFGLKLHRGAWRPWSRAAFALSPLLAQFGLGAPVGITLALELWAFQIGTLIAGRLDAESLAAHSIATSLISLAFMVPLGISFGTSARVGALIGAGKPEAAQVAAHTALKLGAVYALCSATVLLIWGQRLAALFSASPEVLALAGSILPIAGAFQLFDSLQAIGSGVLRGMGRPRPSAAFNFVGYFVVAMPLAYYLALHTEARLSGVWLGYALGLFVVATSLVSWVVVRGPKTVRALVVALPSS